MALHIVELLKIHLRRVIESGLVPPASSKEVMGDYGSLVVVIRERVKDNRVVSIVGQQMIHLSPAVISEANCTVDGAGLSL